MNNLITGMKSIEGTSYTNNQIKMLSNSEKTIEEHNDFCVKL